MNKIPACTRFIYSALSLALLGCNTSDPEFRTPGTFRYPTSSVGTRCDADASNTIAVHSDDFELESGIRYNVRAPSNYRSIFRHPLIIVFAAGGQNRFESERFIGMTKEATSKGFIIAYADNPPLTLESIEELGQIPARVSEIWCIDDARVFFTGHSNGGLISNALAFLPETRHIAAAIAPSAAGISGDDFAEQMCPAPIPLLIMHSAHDMAFRGYGRGAAKWWANCNQCDTTPGAADIDGCIRYENCANNSTTQYCEVSGRHSRWPGMNTKILGFFEHAASRQSMAAAQQ